MSEANKAITRRVVEEIVNRGNFAALDQLIAADYKYFEPTVGELRGREGYKQLVTMYRNAFPDVTLTIDEQVAEGDTVVTRWTARATHKGDLMGIAPTGRQVIVQGIVITRCKDGRIVQESEVYDVYGMMQQLGVVKALGKAA